MPSPQEIMPNGRPGESKKAIDANKDSETMLEVSEISKIHAEHIGKTIVFKAKIKSLKHVRMELVVAHFECRICGIGIDVDQRADYLMKPSVCSSCNKKRYFDLNPPKSQYRDLLLIRVQDINDPLDRTRKERIDVELREKFALLDLSFDDYVKIAGIVRAKPPTKNRHDIKIYISALELVVIPKPVEKQASYDTGRQQFVVRSPQPGKVQSKNTRDRMAKLYAAIKNLQEEGHDEPVDINSIVERASFAPLNMKEDEIYTLIEQLKKEIMIVEKKGERFLVVK
jgi:DNA replicative helicase MCM subunit Mcm2 (Cdc46/Mcm family)